MAKLTENSSSAFLGLPAQLEAYWMPFTMNRHFKQNPQLFTRASGMYYTTNDGRQVLDGIAGLWCVNAGHCRQEIVTAVKAQAEKLDYASSFNIGHPMAFEAASSLSSLLPKGLDYVFFGNSGSEAVDTALKIALAYHRAKGEPQRIRFIGRDRAYHGVGFGGIAVGGLPDVARAFVGALNLYVDHLPHTYNRAEQAFSRGQPSWGAHLADDLERVISKHGASTIAAVIVEPVAGATGVLIPPKGYLEKLRAICTRHDILLIFDEVITGFGRLGAAFGADYFGIKPDMITLAKGLTSGMIPMGAAVVDRTIYEAFMTGPAHAVEFFHGYTYSGHPVAAAAALATLDLYRKEKLFERAAMLAPYFEKALHSLKGARHVIDIRNLGLVGAIELEPRGVSGFTRAFDVFNRLFERDVFIRPIGDTIVLSPALIISEAEIDRIVETIADVLPQIS
jgi:beta-alanine--pyruvate transaminase